MQWRSLPGFEAVVVTLRRYFAIAKFKEHGEVRFHFGAGSEGAQRNREDACPQGFERNTRPLGYFGDDFVALAEEDFPALFATLHHAGQIALLAGRIETVR